MTADNPATVIVGAGHAGGRCAERLRHFGWQGRIVLIGDEPVPPYERPPLSKAVLCDEAEPSPSFVIDRDRIAELGIEHRPNAIVRGVWAKDRQVLLEDGTKLAYSRLVLATGLTPRRLPLIDVLGERVFYLHKFDQARALRGAICKEQKILIVGAGFVGLEVAASAAKLGARVTVVETAPRALSRVLPVAISASIVASHEKSGVRILCGRTLEKVTQTPDEIAVHLDDGTVIRPDIVVVGVGGVPNDVLARSAGLAVSNGIEVDAECRTSNPEIYAIGDIASHSDASGQRSRIESWMNAEETAANAARSICGVEPTQRNVPLFWTDQYDRRLQIVGKFHPDADMYFQGQPGEPGYLAYSVSDERVTGAFGVDAARAVRKAQQTIRGGGAVTHRELVEAGFYPAVETVDA
jgi:3-phenylpropionate/trans-cinnamate dioxygenase ferredoxin reductase subunit